jgi:multicomponent Na+:H+ antiporter subunit B
LRFLYVIIALVTGIFLIYGALDMPRWADPGSPASVNVSPRYIEKSFEETAVPNMVTAVLADYRGYDTLGETTVIFAAGLCCLLILGRLKKKEKEA